MRRFQNIACFFILLQFFASGVYAQDTWYSYQAGEWGDFNSWTKDGATAPAFVNASSETPNAGDMVILRNGHAITMEDGSSAILNSVTIASITIRTGSSLDLLTSSGHNFTDISGGGKLLLSGVRNENGDGVGANDVFEENLPDGDYIDFADGLLGGTIEVNTGANDIPFIFNDDFTGITANGDGAVSKLLRINMGDSNDRAVIQRDIALTGNFIVNQGNLQIHSDASETYEGGTFSGGAISNTNLSITIDQNLTINADGQITTGDANQRHQLNIDGNFTNNGTNTTSFTQRTTQTIGSEATDGIVDLNFLNTVDDQSIVSNGPLNFYRIEIDKGSPSIELSIEASAQANFNLLGFANEGHGYTSQLTDNDNALGLISGAVRLGNHANVEPLNGGASNYNVSENASLIVDGAFVSKESGPAIVPYGSIIVESGTLVSSVGSGVTTRDNGSLRVDGGDVYISQFRTSVDGASAVGGYEQNGGDVTVGDFSGIVGPSGTSYSNSNPNGSYYTFSLTYSGNVFVMSSGVLSVTEPSDNDQGSIFINSSPDNIDVTGGTVNVTSTSAGEARITSKAPFFNLNIKNTTTNTSATDRVTVGTGTSGTGGGAGTQTITDPDLKIINDLTIETGTTRTSGGNTYGGYLDLCPAGSCADVEVGRNLTINDSAVLDLFSGSVDNAGSSTLLMNGNLNALLTIGDVTSYDKSLTGFDDPEGATPYQDWEHPFYNLTIDKPGAELQLVTTGTAYDAGGTGVISDGSGNKNINNWRSNLIKVANDFVLENGSVDLDLYSVRLYGEITNKGVLGIDAMPVNAQVKFRKEASAVTRTVTTADDAEFGNLRMNSGQGIIGFTSNVFVGRLEYKHGRFDIGSNNLKVDKLVFSLTGAEVVGNDFSVEDMIIMDGNASDGGLSIYVPAANNPGLSDSQTGNPAFNPTVYFFPIGTGTTGSYPGSQYTPFNIRLESGGFTDDGYITVSVVDNQLQTTGPSPLGNDVLERYFRVRYDGFGTVPKVERIRATVTQADIPDGTNDTEMIDDGTQVWNPGWVFDSNPYTRNYETNDGAAASSGFLDNGAEDINIYFWGNTWNGSSFDGNPAGGFDLVEANYTAGLSSKFGGSPTIYYSRRNSGFGGFDWDNNTSWYDTPTGTTNPPDFPTAGDIVVIRGDNGQDAINVNGTQEAAEVIFEREGTYASIEDLPRLRLGPTDQLTVDKLSGVGDLYLQRNTSSSAVFTGDIGEFAANDTSLVIFYMNQDGTYTVDEVDFFSVLPTLRIYGNNGNGNRTALFNYDIEVKNLIIDGEAVLEIGGDYTVENRTRLGYTGGGRMRFSDGNTAHSLTTGSLVTGRAKAQQDNTYIIEVQIGGGNGIEHVLEITEDIDLDFNDSNGNLTIDLFSTLADNNVILRLSGNGDHNFYDRYPPGNSTIDLYKIQMSKGSDLTNSFTINDVVNLPSPTASFQPLEILNGFMILNDPSLNIGLAAGGTDYQLPNLANPESSSGSGGLDVRQGTVTITGADTGMILDGSLILSGGDADFADGSNNNSIQYSVGGNAKITINDAASELSVGTQIRRSVLSTSGILDLEITSGDLTIGGGSGGTPSRGNLEIVNSGSSLTHTGGTITFLSDNNYGSSPTTAAFLLEPTSSNLSGSNIVINLTNGDQRFDINSTVALNNVTITSNSGGVSEVVNLKTRPLTINGDLSIGNDIDFQSNDLDLTLNGDFTITSTATYTAGTNKTTFGVASGTNTLSGTIAPTFFDFEKNGAGILQMGSDISITGATFDLNTGTLDDNGNILTFTGQQMTNNATHISPSNSNTNGVIFSGSAQQILQTSNTGVFGNLIIDNSSGVALPDVTRTFRVTNRLVLDEGIWDIGPALLVLGVNSEIVGDAGTENVFGSEFSDFSESNQIQTNSSIIDFGVEKEFNASTTNDFTFPVGEATRYTPAEISFSTAGSGTSGSSSGSVRIRPRNSVAPIMLSETSVVQDAVLQYYWLVNSEDLTGFEADLLFEYDDDVIGTDPESSYEGALAFFSDTDNGISDGIGTVDDATNLITIPISMPITVPADSLSDDENFSGEYFAGDPSRIPDEFVAALFDNDTGNGNVNDPANYCIDSDGDGSCSGEVRPTDFIAEIIGGNISLGDAETMNLNVSNVSFSRTTIPSDATIVIQAGTSNHSFGQISGSGTIQINSNTTDAALPVGDYANFFVDCTSGGGALEYGGTGNYTVLNETSEVRNLLLEGSGSKSMVSNNVNICEDLTISEGSVTFADGFTVTVNRDFIHTDGTVNLAENGTINVKNDITLTAGTINGATNSVLELEGNLSRASTAVNLTGATIEMTGTSQQQISGDFTGGNELGSLTMNNSAGLLVNNDVEIDNTLTLTDGIITTSNPTLANPISTAGVELFMSSTATTTGASDTSYVNGMVTKRSLGISSSFIFPTGANGFLAEVEVSNPSTTTDWTATYVNSNPRLISNNINFGFSRTISEVEYWIVNGSGNATISITYGEQSGVSDATALAVARLKDDNTDGSFTNTDEWALVDVNNTSTNPFDGTLVTTSPQSFSTTLFTVGEQNSGALPVELIELLATEQQGDILVSWKTATETENYGFYVQRSEPLDAEVVDTTWTDLTFISGAGTVTQQQEYRFIDTEVEMAGDYAYRLLQEDYDGQIHILGPVMVQKTAPISSKLLPNYPNPFNPTTNIPYTLSSISKVNITVYNILGQRIKTLVNTQQQPGTYQVKFNADNLSSGIYFIRMIAEGRVMTRKMLLIK
jgi:hypothetical protein